MYTWYKGASVRVRILYDKNEGLSLSPSSQKGSDDITISILKIDIENMKNRIKKMEIAKQKGNDNKKIPKKFNLFSSNNQSDEYINAEIARLTASIAGTESKISTRQDLLRNPKSLARSKELVLNTLKSRSYFVSRNTGKSSGPSISSISQSNNPPDITRPEDKLIKSSLDPSNTTPKSTIPPLVLADRRDAEEIRQDAEIQKNTLENEKRIDQQLREILDSKAIPLAEKKERIQKIKTSTPGTLAIDNRIAAAGATIKKIEIQDQQEQIKKAQDIFTQQLIDAIQKIIKQNPEVASKVLGIPLNNEIEVSEFMKLLNSSETGEQKIQIDIPGIKKTLNHSVGEMTQSYISSITDISLQNTISDTRNICMRDDSIIYF